MRFGGEGFAFIERGRTSLMYSERLTVCKGVEL